MSQTHLHHAGRPRSGTGSVEAPVHAAVVCSVNEVLFIAAASTPEALRERVAEYVRENAEPALFPGDARRVLALLDRGQAGAAIEQYFACVGRRWDAEYLHLRPVRVA